MDEYTEIVLTKEDIHIEEGDYAVNGLLYCGKCRTPRQVYKELNGHTRIVNCICKCRQEERDLREEEWKRQQKVFRAERLVRMGFKDTMLRNYTFDADCRLYPQKREIAKKYVQHWTVFRQRNTGLLLHGDMGTGKTFYAACIANALIEKGIPALMISIPSLLQDLIKLNGPLRQEQLELLDRYELLVLDDYDPRSLNTLEEVILYTVVDRRYRQQKPMIVITNTSPKELEQRSYSHNINKINARILEVCRSVEFLGDNIRKIRLQSDREFFQAVMMEGGETPCRTRPVKPPSP